MWQHYEEQSPTEQETQNDNTRVLNKPLGKPNNFGYEKTNNFDSVCPNWPGPSCTQTSQTHSAIKESVISPRRAQKRAETHAERRPDSYFPGDFKWICLNQQHFWDISDLIIWWLFSDYMCNYNITTTAWMHLPPVSMRAHLHKQLSLSMSLVLKSAPWITRLLCLPAVPLWLFRNSLKDIRRRKRSESGLENMYVGGSGGEKYGEHWRQ